MTRTRGIGSSVLIASLLFAERFTASIEMRQLSVSIQDYETRLKCLRVCCVHDKLTMSRSWRTVVDCGCYDRVFSTPGLWADLTNAFWEIPLRFLLSPGADSNHPTTLSFESKLKPSRIWVVKRYSKMTTKSFFRNFEFFHPKIQFARTRIDFCTDSSGQIQSIPPHSDLSLN